MLSQDDRWRQCLDVGRRGSGGRAVGKILLVAGRRDHVAGQLAPARVAVDGGRSQRPGRLAAAARRAGAVPVSGRRRRRRRVVGVGGVAVVVRHRPPPRPRLPIDRPRQVGDGVGGTRGDGDGAGQAPAAAAVPPATSRFVVVASAAVRATAAPSAVRRGRHFLRKYGVLARHVGSVILVGVA